MLRELGVRLGIVLAPCVLRLLDARVNVDGFGNGPPPTIVEVFAHQGPMKPGQRHKVMADALKLVAIGQHCFDSKARLVLALASDQARSSLSGWRVEALEALGVEVLVIELESALLEGIRTAQIRQRMTNVGRAKS